MAGSKGPADAKPSLTAPLLQSSELELTPEEREFLRSHPVIRVGNEDDWPPFDFSEHGVPQGYAIEHLEILGRKLGISFEYINGYTWSELLNLFREGKIDLLPSLWISENRKDYMLFTKPFLELPYVIVSSKHEDSADSLQDLQGKTVAAPRGYVQEEVLRQSFPEVNLHQVDNPLQGLKAVAYDEAQAYIGYQGVVDYLIATNFFTDLEVKGEIKAPELGPQGLHIAVQQDMPILRDLLEKAMDKVSRKQKVELAQKWITVQQKPQPDLTQEETAYLRKHQVLKVNNLQDWPPFNFTQNQKPKGFCMDYLRLLAEKLGMELEFITGPSWEEFMAMLQNGELDLLADVVETEDRRQDIAFTEPYLTIFSGIVVKQGQEKPQSMQDLADKQVAVPKQFYYQEILDKHYPDIQVTTEENTLECLKSVSSGKADAALAEKPVFDYLITKHFLTGLTSVPIRNSPHLENTPVSIGVAKDRDILRDILQKAMDTVSEEEMSQIYSRWFQDEELAEQALRVPLAPEEQNYLESKEEVRMCVHPGWLPFSGLNEEEEPIGIAPEIMQLVQERIGASLVPVLKNSHQESLQAAENGECDILPCISNPSAASNLISSRPYFESVHVMVTRDDEPYISDLDALGAKTVAVVQDNAVADYLQKNFPQLKLQPEDNLEDALESVSAGEAHLAIDSLQRISYRIHEQGLYGLKIAGQTPYREFLRIGISQKSPELKPILDKALQSIPEQEISSITRDWLSIRYEQGFDTALLWKIAAGVSLLLAVILYWNRKLTRLNKQLARAHEDLEQKSQELERLSEIDRLTGLYNRMKLEDILEHERERADRTQLPLSIAMLDVDEFKLINDTYGHHAGDEVLQNLALLLQEQVRSIDTVGRWGGEEFLLICPATDLTGAQTLAEKLKQAIAEYEFPVAGCCTCSLGVATYQEGERAERMLIRADQAMYRAKAKGRNQVQVM
ncbi:MAG: transporter substrate-binding domain-containing diguanylate cyclase [Thermodesulfobacteriota bacterium]